MLFKYYIMQFYNNKKFTLTLDHPVYYIYCILNILHYLNDQLFYFVQYIGVFKILQTSTNIPTPWLNLTLYPSLKTITPSYNNTTMAHVVCRNITSILDYTILKLIHILNYQYNYYFSLFLTIRFDKKQSFSSQLYKWSMNYSL